MAALLYGGVSTGFAVAFTLLFGRVTLIEVREGRLDPHARGAALRRFGAGTVFYPLLTIIGVVYAPAMLVGFTALSVYYLFNQTGAAEA